MKKMYYAPLEGITGYIYRNAHKKYFGGVDRYYLPFIVPNQTGKLKSKELHDILPENNVGLEVVPQILSNNGEQFNKMAVFLESFGYEEINLNLGCPARTVVTKKRGSGLLAYLDDLERFLETIYNGSSISVSIKTRIGIESPDEFEDILKIYNQFPIKELTIHPRLQQDYYNNKPNLEVFRVALKESRNPICYNGDIFTVEDYQKFVMEFPEVDAIMIGRGLLANPALGDNIKKGKRLEKETLHAFHDELCNRYQEVMSGDRNVLFRMKELWFYFGQSFDGIDKYLKEIRKVNRLCDYDTIVEKVFAQCELR